MHLYFVADIDRKRQRVAAGPFDGRRRGMDGTRQLGMGFSGLGRNDDVCTVASRAQCNGKPDSATCSGNEQSAVVKSCNGKLPKSEV